MGEEREQINKFMGIAMSLTLGIFLGTFGVCLSGHFNITLWIISIVLSCLLGLIMTFLLPIRKLSERASEAIINKFFKALVGSLITNIFYTPVITACMVFTMSYVANNKINLEIANREVQIERATDARDALVNTQLQNGRIENYEKQIAGLKEEIEHIDAGRPQPLKTVWKTILLSYILSVIISMIVQPLWLKLAFKKYLHLR